MRKKQTNDSLKINGYYIAECARGFMGEKGEGGEMLAIMGLPTDTPPFSVAMFLQNTKIHWKDSEGKLATISFKSKHNTLECHGSYNKKKKTIKLFLEWGVYDDAEQIVRLESEAIGECCMKCIYENLII